MKKVFLLNLAVAVLLVSLLAASCKKIVHPAHPTSPNNRILSYSKYTTFTNGHTPINETFRFYYDGSQRVTQIVYSSNDSVTIAGGTGDMLIAFNYSNDTIYKTYTTTHTYAIVERDTLLQNSYGYITKAYSPGETYSYTYFGKLLSKITKSVFDSGTTMSANTSFTSDNADLLNKSYDGNLYVTFPDSGISSYLINHDTALSLPLTVKWYDIGHNTVDSTIHTAVGSYSDVLTNYTSGDPVFVQAIDPYNVIAYDTLFWPGGIWGKESFYVYPDLLDRPGDYLQIESFTAYGVNIYQNNHMVRQIVETKGPTVNVVYTIDADSKVTQTYVTQTDQYNNVTTIVYKFQYETF